MPWNGFFQKMMDGLAESESRFLDDSFSLLDSLLPDNDNFLTDDADQWEIRLGMITSIGATLEDRKAAITRKLAHPSTIKARQHFVYLEGQLRDAGFDVYVHENRFGDPVYPPDEDTSPFVTHQPEDFFPLEGSDVIRDGTFLTASGAGNWTVTGTIVIDGTGLMDIPIGGTGDYAQQVLTAPIQAGSGTWRLRIYLTGDLDDVKIELRDVSGGTLLFTQVVNGAGLTHIIDIDTSGFSLAAQMLRIVDETDQGTVQYVSLNTLIDPNDYADLIEDYYGLMYTNYVVTYIDRERELHYDFGTHLKSTFFIGGKDLFDIAGGNLYADVDATRINELRQLILRLKPVQTKAFLYINEI